MRYIPFLLAIALFSCEKATCEDGVQNQKEIQVDCGGPCEPCALEYPPSGDYGISLVNTVTTTFVSAPTNYSLRVVIPEGSSFKAVFKNTGPEPLNDLWFYTLGSAHNLEISQYNETNFTQEFKSIQSGYCDVKMEFFAMGSSNEGGVEITIYENESETPTRVKNITWTY